LDMNGNDTFDETETVPPAIDSLAFEKLHSAIPIVLAGKANPKKKLGTEKQSVTRKVKNAIKIVLAGEETTKKKSRIEQRGVIRNIKKTRPTC
jgi:hypothetical protein